MALPIVGAAHEQATPGDFTWFIYSSSLSKRAFAEWAERHHYPVPDFSRAIPARLPDHRLTFDVQSGFWGGAVASLAPATGRSVEGIALPLPGASRTLVDHKEGALSGLYEPFTAKVIPLKGGAPIDALVFRASPSRRLPAEAPPSPSFLAALREGAKDFGLSEAYLIALEKLG